MKAGSPHPLDKMLGADPGEVDVRASGQSPGLGNQSLENCREFIIRHFVMERIEQHDRDDSGGGLKEQYRNTMQARFTLAGGASGH
jgi:hypothetical protein